jgi:hypothetical protein
MRVCVCVYIYIYMCVCVCVCVCVCIICKHHVTTYVFKTDSGQVCLCARMFIFFAIRIIHILHFCSNYDHVCVCVCVWCSYVSKLLSCVYTGERRRDMCEYIYPVMMHGEDMNVIKDTYASWENAIVFLFC